MIWIKLTRCIIAVFVFSMALMNANVVMAADATSPVTPAPQTSPPSPEQATQLIHTLQDPQAREQLIEQLNLVSQSQPLAVSVATKKTQTLTTLQGLVESINGIHVGAIQLVQWLHQGREAFVHFTSQLKDLHTRKIWTVVLRQCAVVFGLSYLAFFFSHRFIQIVNHKFFTLSDKPLFKKLFNLIAAWFLNFLPIALFAVVAYLTLILLHVTAATQWILLAWITAFLIVKILTVCLVFLFKMVAAFPGLLAMGNQTIHFLKNWLIALVNLIVYGYFILQVALYLGISVAAYQASLNLLGFLVVLALMVFIVSNPLRLARLLANRKKGITTERMTRVELVLRAALIIYLLLLYMVWVFQAQHFFWFVLKGTILSLFLLFLAVKLVQWIHKYLSGDFHLSYSFKKRLPGLEQRIRHYRKILDLGLRIFIYIVLARFILKIWGIEIFAWLASPLQEIWAIKIVSIMVIVLVFMLIWEVSNSLIEISLTKKAEDILVETGRTHTLLTMARKALLITISLIVSLMILSELGVNIGPLLAGAGVLGLAISFGAQKLVQDVITGFFMLLENQIAVGDVVKIADKSGTVEAISIRTVRLRDSGGVVHIIPYSSIVTVSNLTKDFSYYLFNISVAYRENVDYVITVLQQIAAELQNDPEYKPLILEPLDVLGLDQFADSAVIIKARLKTKPVMQWKVGREFNRRMKQKFDELDIQIPFPHTVIFFGEDKKTGSAPPGHLQVTLDQKN